jgi:hypothetical protein
MPDAHLLSMYSSERQIVIFEPSACVFGGEDKPECRKSEGSLNGQRVAWAACEKDCLDGLGLTSETMPRSQLEQMFPNVDGYAAPWHRHRAIAVSVWGVNPDPSAVYQCSLTHCKRDDVLNLDVKINLPIPAT